MSDDKKNILIAYPHLLLPHRGGTERVACTVGEALRAKGFSVFYLSHCVPDSEDTSSLSSYHFVLSQKLTAEERKNAVLALCKSHEIDVVINEGGEFGYFDIFSKHVLGPATKVITCLHFDVYGEIKYFRRDRQYRNITTSRFKRCIVHLLTALRLDPYRFKFYFSKKRKHQQMLEISDAVVVPTPVIADQLKKITGIKSEKIFSILNPVSFESTSPRYDVSLKEKVILYVGRFSPDKNVDIIIKAWEQLAPKYSEWSLEIAGDGEMREALHDLVRERNIPRVIFHGHVKDVIPLYNRAEYVVLASDCESHPCVIQEALLFGCYPIVFAFPAARCLIFSNRIGSIINKHHVDCLADELACVIDNSVSNKKNVCVIENFMSKYNPQLIGDEWNQLLENLVFQKSDC